VILRIILNGRKLSEVTGCTATVDDAVSHRRRRHRAGGGTCPQISDSGAWGHNRIYGTPVKKFKRLMKKPNIQQRKCSA